uniref:Uncharacterized protein n=1 Tax=Tanacetum cinerariifolium TaxID=118510 RepID=A0A6L2J3M0_TANCI|nr:hypothetical protein [Tanacetum cinerariifolium]
MAISAFIFDHQYDSFKSCLKIYEAEVKSSSPASTSTQNITFVSSNNTDNTNEPVSTVASVSATSAKIPNSVLPNVDTFSNTDHVQAKIDADYQMAKRLQAEEQQELTDEEKATLFMKFLKKRKKKEAQGFEKKSFDSIQKMFDKDFNRVNTFVDFITALDEGSSKRVGEELTQERSKKKKVDDDKETSELKKLMEIIPNEEEVAIDTIPLAVKSPKFIEWKIDKEGKKSYYQIIRADGNSKMYMHILSILRGTRKASLDMRWEGVLQFRYTRSPREILAAGSEYDVRIKILEQELETVRSKAEDSNA